MQDVFGLKTGSQCNPKTEEGQSCCCFAWNSAAPEGRMWSPNVCSALRNDKGATFLLTTMLTSHLHLCMTRTTQTHTTAHLFIQTDVKKASYASRWTATLLLNICFFFFFAICNLQKECLHQIVQVHQTFIVPVGIKLKKNTFPPLACKQETMSESQISTERLDIRRNLHTPTLEQLNIVSRAENQESS